MSETTPADIGKTKPEKIPFPTMLEKGPFATYRKPTQEEGGYVSSAKHGWHSSGIFNSERVLNPKDILDPEDKIKPNDPRILSRFRTDRDFIFQLLNVNSFPDIQKLVKEEKQKPELYRRTYGLLGKMYGLEGSEETVERKINGFAKDADGFVDYLRDEKRGIAESDTDLAIRNEITLRDNPVDLILMTLNEDYSHEIRFTAKRKLFLMNEAADEDKVTEQIQNKLKIKELNDDIIDKYVLNKEDEIGKAESVWVLSEHDLNNDFICKSWEIKNERPQDHVRGQKITELRRRKFFLEGQLTSSPIQIDLRDKDKFARIAKGLRKGLENSRLAVEDDLGFLGVLEKISDVRNFEKRLRQGSTSYGSGLYYEDVDDHLKKGQKFTSENVGSDPNTRMRKFYAKLAGMRVEFILHDINSYLDYQYQRGVAHDEYEAKRLIDTGVIELLFPKVVFGRDWKDREPRIIRNVRERLER